VAAAAPAAAVDALAPAANVAAAAANGARGPCRAYSPGTHVRKDEDGLLSEFPYNPTRTRFV
jgi:hypothetical protein